MSEEYNENEELENGPEESGKPKKGSRIVLIIAVLLLAGLNIFLFNNINTQKKDLEEKQARIVALKERNDSLVVEMEELEVELTSFRTDNARLDSLRQAYLDELTVTKEDLKKYKGLYDGAEAKISSFRNKYYKYKKLYDKILTENDSLKTLAKRLEEERAALQTAADTLNRKLNEYENTNADLKNKVALGQRLSGKIILAVGMKKKGNKAPRATTKASQANMVSITYSINANNIAVKGPKTAYICIKSNGKAITADGNNTTLKNGKEIAYTFTDPFSYEGTSMNRTASYDLTDALVSGKYQVEIFIDGTNLTTGEFEMR